MFTLPAQIRQIKGKKVKNLRMNDILPAVLYGTKIKPICLQINLKFFEKIYKQVERSSLIKLKINQPEKSSKEYLVLIHAVQQDPITEKIIHADFYQPKLEEKIEAKVGLIFEGEAPAVKELGGILVKNIYELTVKALPQNLPKEIKVDVSSLKKFGDAILVKDLIINKEIEILRSPEDLIVSVVQPKEIEEELEKPIEEKVEEVEKIEKKTKEEEEKVENL